MDEKIKDIIAKIEEMDESKGPSECFIAMGKVEVLRELELICAPQYNVLLNKVIHLTRHSSWVKR